MNSLQCGERRDKSGEFLHVNELSCYQLKVPCFKIIYVSSLVTTKKILIEVTQKTKRKESNTINTKNKTKKQKKTPKHKGRLQERKEGQKNYKINRK